MPLQFKTTTPTTKGASVKTGGLQFKSDEDKNVIVMLTKNVILNQEMSC